MAETVFSIATAIAVLGLVLSGYRFLKGPWAIDRTVALDVTVKTLPGSESLASNNHSHDESGTLNGVGVTDLDQNARRQFNIPETVKGAVITEVKPDSAAASAGLRPGDVIVEINRKSVQNAEDAVAMTEKTDSKRTLLRVWREGGSRFVLVDESKAG